MAQKKNRNKHNKSNNASNFSGSKETSESKPSKLNLNKSANAFVKLAYALVISSGILAADVKFVRNLSLSVTRLEENVADIKETLKETVATKQDISNMATNQDLTLLKNQLDLYNDNNARRFAELSEKLEKKADEVDLLERDVAVLKNSSVTYTVAITNYQSALTRTLCEIESVKSVENELWDSDEPIFQNVYTGKRYSSKELAAKPILASYEEDGKEVFFYGQYSQEGRWDQKCIVNVYQNNQLELITEAEYDNGKLISSSQLYKYTTNAGEDVWCISKRSFNGNDNIGDCWNYIREKEFSKDFGADELDETKILSLSSIGASIKTRLEGFYHGSTADGYYNDNSGTAYMVKYDENEKVRFLYMGDVKNGQPYDDSGNAWCISWGYDNENYYYYKGIFYDENSGTTLDSMKKVTQEEINEIIKEQVFSCSLKGLV